VKHRIFILAVALAAADAAQATVLDQRLADYQRQGAKGFSARAGEALWNKEFSNASSGKPRSCASCHGRNLAEAGKHVETGKHIKPMKPSANVERLTDARKIEKWFTRNCKWTFGRECTPQEKGDFLVFINK
jgi:hypothetical protein